MHKNTGKNQRQYDTLTVEGASAIDANQGKRTDVFNIVRLLRACSSYKDLAKGCKLHAYIQEHRFLEKNGFIANTLVSMYARCGALAKAQQLLEELRTRDVVTWTALIAGYAQQGEGEEALKMFECMQLEGHKPDVFTFTCVLKACGRIGTVPKGKQIHEMIASLGMLEKDIVLGNALVDMYARCGSLAKAQQVLKELPVRDVVTWNTLIAGYIQHGEAEEALNCFDSMHQDGQPPNVVTFTCALMACGIVGAVVKAEQIHDKIASFGMLGEDIVLGNALVDVYARFGELAKAQQVLEELPLRDVVTWNVLLAGYVQQGRGEEALNCFHSMQCKGFSPDVISFTCALKACRSIGAVARVEQIHDQIVSLGMLGEDIVLGNALVDVYARCGAIAKAQKVLEELPIRDVVTWNAVIAGYVQQGQGEEAIDCFNSMQREGYSPDAVTFICALKACGNIGKVAEGKKIHDKLISLAMLQKSGALGSSLVDMYARCGELAKAQQVLELLPVRDVVTWNALIAGYAQQGQGEEALKCFDSMQQEGYCPDAITFTCALKACGIIGSVARANQIHERIFCLGMLRKDGVLGNVMVDTYSRCGALAKAQEVLKELPVRDVIMWNALIGGYVRQGHGEEALNCFDSVLHDGHFPNVITFTCALKACGSIGALAKVEQIHDKIVALGMLAKDDVLGNCLVDTYVKCAALAKALEVFKELPAQNVSTWNALIGGYALQGQSLEAMSCFERMQFKGLKADSATLICLLNAYSHSGQLDKAEMLLLAMRSKCAITPDLEHFCCMVDLFGRAGNFNRAIYMIEQMPSVDYPPVWIALLGACRKWGKINIGRFAFEHVLHLDMSNPSAYVLMAYIYTAAGMQEDADKIDVMGVINKA